MKFISLGVVARPFGIRGELRIRPHNPRTTWFDSAEGLWLRGPGAGEPTYYRILKRKRHKEYILLDLEGVHDRNLAETLKGREVVVPEDRLEPRGEDEFYWYQLIGLSVQTPEGRAVGEVIRIEETDPDHDGNDVFVVRGPGGESLVPASREAVLSIDLEAGRMVVNLVIGPEENRDGNKAP